MAKKTKEQDVIDAQVVSETGPDPDSDQTQVESNQASAANASRQTDPDASLGDDDDAPDKPHTVENPDPVDTQEAETLASHSDDPYDAELPEHEPVRSLSSRVLRSLSWVLVGVALTLWAAPRLAAVLPAGLAPVADFLAPGQSAQQARMVAQQKDLVDRIRALETRELPGLDTAAIERQLLTAMRPLRSDLDQLRADLADASKADPAPDIARLETALEAALKEIEAVNTRLSTQITENGATLSAEAGAQLADLRSQIVSVTDQFDDLSTAVSALKAQADASEAAAVIRAEAAEAQSVKSRQLTQAQSALTDIKEALSNGQSFAVALQDLGATDLASDVPAVLENRAASGLAAPDVLLETFDPLARNAITADRAAQTDGSLTDRISAFLQTQIGARSVARRSGDDVDAILSRVEDDVKRGAYTEALSEAETLSQAARAPLADWLVQVQDLAQAHAALDKLRNQLQEMAQ